VKTTASAGIAITLLTAVLALPAIAAEPQTPNGYPGTAAAPVPVPKTVLEKYVGEWVYPDGNSVAVRLKGDTLFREVPGQSVPFVPLSETRFRLGPVFTAEFVIEQGSRMTQIITDGAAVEYRLHRKGDKPAAPPAPAAAVRVPRPVLERYVGEYEYLPGQMSRTDLSVTIRLKGDTLLGLGSGMRETVLTPLSETRFQLGSTSLVWEFESDQANGVTLVMGSGFQQMMARLKAKRPRAAAPETPAGQAVSEWLNAFNGGDTGKLRAFFDRYQSSQLATVYANLRQQTGGFDLISIEKSEPRYIEFVVKERASEIRAVGVVELNNEAAPGMKQWTLLAIPEGKQLADFSVDAARRASVIERAIAALNNDYVFSAVAQKMAADVRSRLNRGDFDKVTNGITFAARLTEAFREVSHDKHLRVNFSPGGAPKPSKAAAAGAPDSCGVTATLEQNGKIGIIKLNGFANLTPHCGGEATEAIGFVADADALIFDLRENGGGDARMVAFISSYLFDQRTHLNDVLTRRRDASGRLIVPDQFWAHESWANDPEPPGRKYGGKKPVYVLTSSATFSAAEEFTYNLQALKRATVVGEQTGGGAHPTRPSPIDENFSIGVPFARSVNPITETNWEGTGVTPDVKVPAAQALETAKNLILGRRLSDVHDSAS
jgi:hypothetical protein